MGRDDIYSICRFGCVIHLSLPSDFRDNLWLGLHFWTEMLFQDRRNMLTQEHLPLGKIMVTI